MATATAPLLVPAQPVPAVSAPTPEQEIAAKAAETRLAQLLAQGDVSQANAATGLYGDSGMGKSAQAAEAVEYCWERFHRISRYYTADPGGFGNKLLRLIRMQICQVYNPTNHIEPFETMEDCSFGYWPERVDDPFTGFAQPDIRLVPPVSTRWVVSCPQGHAVRTVTDKKQLSGFSLQCPTCKMIVTVQNWGKVEEVTIRAAGVKNVGLYIFDSGSALQDWAMQDMASRAARGEVAGEGSALGREGKIVSGKYVFGANNRAHYGFAQNRMRTWIMNSRTIPGQVVPPIWTFLEERAADESGRPIYGPKIAGNAKTPDVPSWLGNCLHLTKEKNDRGIDVHRIWLVNHIDMGGTVPHLAKTRAEPGTMDTFLEDLESEPPFTRCSLKYFFMQLEQALDIGTRQDAVDHPDAPLFIPLPDAPEEIVSRKDLSGSETQVKVSAARPATVATVGRPAVGTAVATVAPKPATVAPAATTAPPKASVPSAPAPTSPATPASGPAAVPAQPKPAGQPAASPSASRKPVAAGSRAAPIPAAATRPMPVAAAVSPAPTSTVATPALPVAPPVAPQAPPQGRVETPAATGPAAPLPATAGPVAPPVRPPIVAAIRPAHAGRPPVPPAGTKRS